MLFKIITLILVAVSSVVIYGCIFFLPSMAGVKDELSLGQVAVWLPVNFAILAFLVLYEPRKDRRR